MEHKGPSEARCHFFQRRQGQWLFLSTFSMLFLQCWVTDSASSMHIRRLHMQLKILYLLCCFLQYIGIFINRPPHCLIDPTMMLQVRFLHYYKMIFLCIKLWHSPKILCIPSNAISEASSIKGNNQFPRLVYNEEIYGLRVSVPDYWSLGRGFDSQHFQNFKCVLDLERNPPSLVRTIG